MMSFSFGKVFFSFSYSFVRNVGSIECSKVVKFDYHGPWRTFNIYPNLCAVFFFFFILCCCALHVNKKFDRKTKMHWMVNGPFSHPAFFWNILHSNPYIDIRYTTRLDSNLIYWLYGHWYNLMGCNNVSRLHFISEHQTDATCHMLCLTFFLLFLHLYRIRGCFVPREHCPHRNTRCFCSFPLILPITTSQNILLILSQSAFDQILIFFYSPRERNSFLISVCFFLIVRFHFVRFQPFNIIYSIEMKCCIFIF